MERRKYDRGAVDYAISFSGDSFGAQGGTLDLSVAGCRARTAFRVSKGDHLWLLIHVPRYEALLEVELAVVRWSAGNEFGMEFLSVQREHEQRLHELIRATNAIWSGPGHFPRTN